MSDAWDRLAQALTDLDLTTLAQQHLGREPGRPAADGPDREGPRGPGSGGPGAEQNGAGQDGSEQPVPGYPGAGHQGPGHQGPECRVCPVCRLIAFARQLSPEVLDHLVAAAGELALAIRLGAAEHAAREAAGNGARPGDDEPGTEGSAPGTSRTGAPAAGATGAGPPPVEHIEVTD